jgi:hypothetical protein
METVKAIVQYKLPLMESMANLYSVSVGRVCLWEGPVGGPVGGACERGGICGGRSCGWEGFCGSARACR